MKRAVIPRTCIVCQKKREKECSHVDCPNRRQEMRDPLDSHTYQRLLTSGTYKRKSSNYQEGQ